MKKNAVVFSSWVPSNALHRGNIYLSFIRDYFGDSDIYIGVNSNSDLAWVDIIEEILPEAQISLVDPELSINSDVPAFQAALKLLKASNQEYENVYFIHTKGISYPLDSTWYVSCRDYFMQFIEKRKGFDSILEKEDIGGWAHIARKFTMKDSGYLKSIANYIDTPNIEGIQDTMWLITHYAIKGKIVKWFLDKANDDFFNKKIEDRYFFEASFPLIVDLYGKTRFNEVFWE